MMKRIKYLLCLCWLLAVNVKAQVKHVVLISIDGFHPDMYLDKGWPTPNLQYLMRQGTYADHLLSVFPAYTYPSHTAMLTGALPARSKIAFNQPMNSHGEWLWFASAVKVPTIWQALRAKRLTSAAVTWPGSVGAKIDWNIPDIWSIAHSDDRITEARNYATPGLIEDIEKYATGKLDSTNFNDAYFSWDENIGRAAAYIFKTKKPAFMAVHFANVDDQEHDDGRDADSVRMAIATDDRAIGDILEAIDHSHEKDSTAVIIVGDHGFATINQAFRPNMLIKSLPVRFLAAGGSAFLYHIRGGVTMDNQTIIKAVTDSLNKLPKDKRKLFRIIYRKELDQMGADSAAMMALAAQPGLVFSSSIAAANVINHGPGTLIQQNAVDGLFVPVHGGHHGYDPSIPEMWTGFIATGAGILKGGHIDHLSEPDIAVLIAKLLGIDFKTPDGKYVPGILVEKHE